MNGNHIYQLYKGMVPVIISTNFSAIYLTLKKYKEKLDIAEIQAYSTLVPNARKGHVITFRTHTGESFWVKRHKVVCKPVSFKVVTEDIF